MVQPYRQNLKRASRQETDSSRINAWRQCTLVEAMSAAEAAKAAKAEKEKAAAVAAEEATSAATAEDQRWQKGQRIETKGMLQMKAIQENNGRVVESAEERVARFKSNLEQSMW